MFLVFVSSAPTAEMLPLSPCSKMSNLWPPAASELRKECRLPACESLSLVVAADVATAAESAA